MENRKTSFVTTFALLFTMVYGEKFVINLTISENKGGGEDLVNLRTYSIQKKWKINYNGIFEIVPEPEIGNYFLLDSKSGQLKLRSHIDREAICKHTDYCKLTILVSVDGQVVEVMIEVLDVNDNSPQFAMRYKTLIVQENTNVGSEISLPTAEDLDSAKHGIIKYYIEDSLAIRSGKMERYKATKYFRILDKTLNNVKIPYLKTIKEIDREEIDQFELILVAEDSDKHRGSCTITINVADVNDNSPQWPTSSIHKKVRECDQLGPLLELQAFDRDDSSTANGKIRYKISDHSPKMDIINRIFYIKESKLYFFINSLQTVEIWNKMSFFITAIDDGGRENDTSVTVEIEDCNDHAPSIILSRSSTTVAENDKTLRLLTTVTVKDDDREMNSEFSCDLNDTTFLSLTKQHSYQQPNGAQLIMYQLEKVAGVTFDRERIDHYSVVIRCIDQGRPSLTSEKMFTALVSDVNDNPPTFPNKDIRFSITENNVVGAIIGYVKAIDVDSIENGRITYQILNNEDNVYFTITNYGKIEAKWKFDREQKSSFVLIVIARDNGDPSLNDTCNVRITILDVNDCLPAFKQPYFYRITERIGSITIQETLGKITAEDQDLGENGTIYYEIRQSPNGYKAHLSNSRPILKIGFDGTLSIYGVVDREKISTIQAEVIAFDKGRPQLSSVTTVVIDVLDVNDNKPKFKYPMNKINYINVTADTPVGTILASVEAEDPDKGENGTVSYTIIGQKAFQDNSLFQLQQDGRLILIQSLKDRDPALRLPDFLQIRASDGGYPQQFDDLTIHIKYVMSEKSAKDTLWPVGDRKQNERGRLSPGVLDGYRDNESADNMVLLYILAGVLFTVFLIVLLVLMYTYFSGRFLRGRHHDNLHEKQLNNFCNDGPGSYECELLTAGSPTEGREDFHKVSAISMSFPTVEKGNYTHLMMNDSNYTPIQITPNYFQTIRGTIKANHQTELPQSNPPTSYEFSNLNRVSTSTRNSNRLSNKWNSIENISQTNDTTIGGSKPNGPNNISLHNAHSYAAYINQFGKDDVDHNMWIGNNANNMKLLQQASHHSTSKLSKDDPSVSTYEPVNCSKVAPPKKCYVTSSFV